MSPATKYTGRSASHRFQDSAASSCSAWKLLATIAVFLISIANCSEAGRESPSTNASVDRVRKIARVPLPPELAAGEQKYAIFCSGCHGIEGQGTDHGPPLVHKIYEPSHHSDLAFQRAAANGVRAHHWNFGDMPPIEGITSHDVTEITRYIRWLQRQAGIV
ncbi:MAG: cytochrome c [Nitrospirae bacterium]|nr:MAG: cytochrome c [Nitrospirota bacterium]